MLEAADEVVSKALASVGIQEFTASHREFPDEHWVLIQVPIGQLASAQALVKSLEADLSQVFSSGVEIIVVVRPAAEVTAADDATSDSGLARPEVDQLIQLLEARSRTSDALPSLRYVEDPRASLSVVSVQRHHIVYGRRGVGKTALLLEAKRLAENAGHVCVWLNAQALRRLAPANAMLVIAERLARAVVARAGDSGGSAFARVEQLQQEAAMLLGQPVSSADAASAFVARINEALRAVLREDLLRAYVFVDDFYLLDIESQPEVLDYLHSLTRDANCWIKIASIERLTRTFEPSTRSGLEVPHDATTIDLDVTLQDPRAAQIFLERVLGDYTAAAGLPTPRSIVKPDALSRLVLASGGVPRDYLSLLASAIVEARKARSAAREVGKEDVAKAAGGAARSKRRDLEQDVRDSDAPVLIAFFDKLASAVKSAGFTYFLARVDEPTGANYDRIGRLVDLRFCHLIQASLSDQHKPGVRYEAYILDLSAFADVRLKRGLNVLDLASGTWTLKRSGTSGAVERLDGTKLRDRLRRAPMVEVGETGPAGVILHSEGERYDE